MWILLFIISILLLAVAPIGLILGLIKPQWLKMKRRKQSSLVFSGLFLGSFLLTIVSLTQMEIPVVDHLQSPVAETTPSSPPPQAEPLDTPEPTATSQTAALDAPGSTETPQPQPVETPQPNPSTPPQAAKGPVVEQPEPTESPKTVATPTDTPDAQPAETLVGQSVAAAEYGEDWPFTVQQGTVDCLQGGAAIFRSEGKIYQLNGKAASLNYLPLDPIWRDNPEIPGTKINIGPMIKLALEQCDG